jgi:hypothetical protein
MSIMSDFLTLVDPILDGQAYRNVVPDSAVAPYAKFFRVASVEGVTLDENGGDDNETATRIQIDIYGASPDVDAKTAAVKAALKTWHISNIIQLEMDGFEDEVKLHRATLDIATIHQ